MNLLHALNIVFLIKLTHGDAKIYFDLEMLLQRGGLEENEVGVSDVTTEDNLEIEIETTEASETIPMKKMEASCPDDAIWCDAPSDYPEEMILKAVIKQNQTFNNIFVTKEKSQDFITISQPSTSVSLLETRLGPLIPDEEEFQNICGLTTSYIKPRAAKNKDGEYRFIVNHPDGADEYLQVVRVSTCNNNNESCGGGKFEGTGLGFETKCQQEFSDHKLVALSATGEELVVEEFRFPSCCTCLIRESWK